MQRITYIAIGNLLAYNTLSIILNIPSIINQSISIDNTVYLFFIFIYCKVK